MKIKLLLLIIIFQIFLSCGSGESKPVFMATSYPITMILQEIVGNKAVVETMVPVGASPHVYTPTPTDVKKAGKVKAFFYVAANYDGWSSNITSKTKIEVIKLVPKALLKQYSAGDVCEHGNHNHSEKVDSTSSNIDAHFWTDPMTVKEFIPALVDTLSKIDPDNASTYRTNADIFMKRLIVLDKQVYDLMKDLRGKNVFLYHPSLNYFLERYGLVYAGTIEEIPGKEPSAKFMAQLINKIKESGTKAVFSEPQLPEKPAKLISEDAGVRLYMLDPIGGSNNIKNYSDLILFNAKILKKAL